MTHDHDPGSGSAMGALAGCFVMACVLAYAGVQIWAGYLGLQHFLGTWWAVGIVGLSVFLRISFPVTVGAFLGAWVVWGWHWALALAFALPGLAFMALMMPGALVRSLTQVARRSTGPAGGVRTLR